MSVLSPVLILTVACPLLTWAADDIKPLNVKLGLWESSTTNQSSGMPPIPAEVLARMTPEQRAKMEGAMKARESKGPQTQTRKSCLTKEQLDKLMAFGDDKTSSCKRTVIKSTSSVQDIHFDCDQNAMKATGDLHVEATSPEDVKGSTQMNMGGANGMKINVAFTAHWLGADCGSVK